MELVTLPGTNLTVSRIGFGAEPLGGTDWGSVDEPEMLATVSKALDVGINLFDTADVYGLGRSETLLSKGLGHRRHEAVIVSKFGVAWHRSVGTRAVTYRDSSPRRVNEAVEASLRRLRVDSIPIYLVHWPDPSTPIAKTMDALLECQLLGKVQYIGVSNFSLAQLTEAHSVARLTVLETQFNLLQRQVETGLLKACRQGGIGVLVYGALAQGLLTGKYDETSAFPVDDRRRRLPAFQDESLRRSLKLVTRVRHLARYLGRSPAQVAVRWVLDHPVVSSTIVGVKTLEQLMDNVGASGWSLSQEHRDYLESGDEYAE